MLRWQYVRLLTEFETFKHREIFAPALRDGTSDKAPTARQLEASCAEISRAFRAYVMKWSTVDKNACWENYREAAAAIIQRLRDHLEAEGPAMRLLLS